MRVPGLLTGLASFALLWLIAPGSPAREAAPAAAPTVVTTAGAVTGTNGEVRAFKGIPYAAPPVGPLRWRAPQPPIRWHARDATRFGDDCMQRPYVIPTGQKTSEDCLTVSVWTGAHAPDAHQPVMVYLYGGGFIGGSCAYPLYDGAALASEGVVVVCFNYRVGIFGFLAHPMLSAESPHRTSGNYGLLDQIAALKWVKDNIAAFGGDPQRVTVFGESAGAVSIALLLASPSARGLFSQAIMLSPAVLPLASRAQAEQSGAALGDLATLRQMNAAQLLAHNDDFFPHSPAALMPMAFPAPTIDGDVVPGQPRAAFESGAVNAVPTIVGTAADEGRMFAPTQTVATYQAWVRSRFGPLSGELLALNPAATDAEATAAGAAILGDAEFGQSARLIARAISRHQPETFFYLFTRGVAGRAQPATHSEVLPYVFGSLDKPSFIPHPPPDATDLELSALIRRALARFATSGNPNGAGLPNWPKYDRASDPYLELGTRIQAGRAYRKTQLDAIERHYAGGHP